MSAKFWLSLEISTHQFTVIVVDENLKVVLEDWVNFEKDLPEFGTVAGATHHDDGKTVTAPTLMWVKALDVILHRMKSKEFEFSKVVALSGTAQQHGSVYWNKGSNQILKSLDPNKTLHEQIQKAFVIKDSPIWMDSSTESECQSVEKRIGGAKRLCEITGCRAYHRMTGNQIAKMYRTNRKAYDNTERISLVSSFAASLLLGDYAPIDMSDGSGMNIMDVKTKAWSSEVIESYGIKGILEKLGPLVTSDSVIGHISSYMVKRYGFNSQCKIIAFTGDNPASFAGMRPERGDLLISLGTSDTLMIWLDEPKICTEGMVLVNPMDSMSYIGMLCFKNGGLGRDKVKKSCGLSSWEQFERLLSKGVPGNNGNIGVFFHSMEITPHAVGELRWNSKDEPVAAFQDSETEVRALVEGQCMARRLYAQKIGLELGKTKRILATGGASQNKPLLQILANVFNAPVYIQKISNSAYLGSAFIAKYASSERQEPFQKSIPDHVCPKELCAMPDLNSVKVYDKLMGRYERLEKSLIKKK